MVTTPVEMPVTTPVVEPISADVEELLHVPPAVASVKVIVPPTPTVDGPLIAAGPAVTVTTCVATQPVS